MTHIPKQKPVGTIEALFASIIEGILEVVKAVNKLNDRVEVLEKKARKK